MTAPDTADNRSSPRQGKDRSCRLSVRARVGAAQRRFVSARGRFEGSPAQTFLGQFGALDFTNSVVLFGASLLLWFLPFIILLSSLANHRCTSPRQSSPTAGSTARSASCSPS